MMRSSNGKTDVVAPTSAPMLVIVAFPVQLIERVPGPKNSMIASVPPLVVRMPQSFKMTSFGEAQPPSVPVRRTPISLGHFTSHGRPAMTSEASAPPTPIASIPRPLALGGGGSEED